MPAPAEPEQNASTDQPSPNASAEPTLTQRAIGTYRQVMVATHESREFDNRVESWFLIVMTSLFVAAAMVSAFVSAEPLAIVAGLGAWVIPFAIWKAEKARPKEAFPTRSNRSGYVTSFWWLLLALGYPCLVVVVMAGMQ